MSQILLGALTGTVAGALIGVVSMVSSKKKREMTDLGHQWAFVLNDEQLTTYLHRLKAFSAAAPDEYRQIGDTFNRLGSLWHVTNDAQVPAETRWSFMAGVCETKVQTLLRTMYDRVRSHRQHGATTGPSMNLIEFQDVADTLDEFCKTYKFNIMAEVANRVEKTKKD
jgi:hypothetical protein